MASTSERQGSLAEQIDRCIARKATRELDWDALKFQAEVDPKYGRAQMRYVGGGGTGKHDDPNIVSADHFTFSTMVIPAGHEGPSHVHHDVEEVFFVLEGEITCLLDRDGQHVERVLGPRDLISIPAGVYRGVRNDTAAEAAMVVVLGAGRPQLPTYPEDHPLAKVRRG
jgi:mannose-6-phosphate isomerase-like protein (cupin superfamily)